MYTALDDAAGCSAPVTQAFTYDADGNMLSDGVWTYVWDLENRLAEARESAPVEGSRKLVLALDVPADQGRRSHGDASPGDAARQGFAYDYMSRRVRRQVFTFDAAAEAWRTTPQEDVRFVYDGWNLILELDGMDDLAVIRRYTWGLDLSGTRQGAGGIGGLLAVHDVATSKDYIVFSDANGNVGQLIDLSDSSIAAKYEYDAYGNSLLDPTDANESGPYAAANPFRFSTKYYEPSAAEPSVASDAGLYYYGYRYYRPDVGRWMSRDPIGEGGGVNVFGFVLNNAPSRIDAIGLTSVVISNPAGALDHFLRGGGAPATLSSGLIEALENLGNFKEWVRSLQLRAVSQAPQCDSNTTTEIVDQQSDFLTDPLTNIGYSFSLNTTIGTISLLEATGTCVVSFDKPVRIPDPNNGCKCACKGTVKCDFEFHLRDSYNFQGANNILLSWIPGTAFVIDNRWSKSLELKPLLLCPGKNLIAPPVYDEERY